MDVKFSRIPDRMLVTGLEIGVREEGWVNTRGANDNFILHGTLTRTG